ncbi:LOW QUALITY PROTEIN: hypothetical protein BT93_A0549 [Corymbia citriodora subsp. variegata]|nr:LOW QUALITY PROTEIN: hypothetical protein BT93_A0549 [Corymbia citriodora subsp. variegata]
MGKFRTPHAHTNPQRTRGREKKDPTAQISIELIRTMSDGHRHQDRRVPHGRSRSSSGRRSGSSRSRRSRGRRTRKRRRLPGHDGGEPESRQDKGGEVREQAGELVEHAEALPHQHLHQ